MSAVLFVSLDSDEAIRAGDTALLQVRVRDALSAATDLSSATATIQVIDINGNPVVASKPMTASNTPTQVFSYLWNTNGVGDDPAAGYGVYALLVKITFAGEISQFRFTVLVRDIYDA